MTIYADTPRWPRHGTLWGHLVSDDSLAELHAAAAAMGLPGRSFDLDHYDWPQERTEDLRAAGVTWVDGRELTRRLIASGLRIPLRDRPGVRAARTARAAAQLGLHPVPSDLILGGLGHAEPLPDPGQAPPGAFRLSREDPRASPRVQAHDADGHRAARELLEHLDTLSRERGEDAFVGQVLVSGSSGAGGGGESARS